MVQKKWLVNGIEIVSPNGYLDFDYYEPAILLNMTFYLLKDIKWIKNVWIYTDEITLYMILRIKDDIKTEYVEEVMHAGMMRISKHVKDLGLNVGYTKKSIMDTIFYTGPINGNCVRVSYRPKDQEGC